MAVTLSSVSEEIKARAERGTSKLAQLTDSVELNLKSWIVRKFFVLMIQIRSRRL